MVKRPDQRRFESARDFGNHGGGDFLEAQSPLVRGGDLFEVPPPPARGGELLAVRRLRSPPVASDPRPFIRGIKIIFTWRQTILL